MAALLLAGCEDKMAENQKPTPKRDINAVLRDHDRELLAHPNVAGVYVGVAENNQPCLKVMLRHQPLPTDPAFPGSIEGYPVITEVTGDIRPLASP
jgi:hypothetical protein